MTLFVFALVFAYAFGRYIGNGPTGERPAGRHPEPPMSPAAALASALADAQAAMVRQVRSYGGVSDDVLAALGRVPRHAFIPGGAAVPADSYGDHPVSIGSGQTISQPFIVGYMTTRLGVRPGDRVLEIGSGSGYQAAVLAELGAVVYSVERLPELSARAAAVLAALGYGACHLRVGDGYAGWPEAAPFAGIVVTCAAPTLPAALLAQLRPGGRLVVPVGIEEQRLEVVSQDATGRLHHDTPMLVRFVPMIAGPE